MPKTMKVTVSKCARCGGDHKDIVFTEFTEPCNEYTYFAMCPTFHEPILLQVVTEKSKKAKKK